MVVVVVVVVVVGWVVVVVADGDVVVVEGGVGVITVTVGLLLGPKIVVVMGSGEGAGTVVLTGLLLDVPSVSPNTTATKMASPAAARLNTTAARLYHGKGAASA